MCRWLVDEAGEDVNTLRPSGEPRDWSLDDNKFMDYFLILQKSDINMTDERGKTALHCAAEHGYLERVQELIHSGANVQAVDENGWNAFHFACKSNSDRKKELIQLLHTTDSLLAKEKTGSGQTGLHISVEFRKFYSVNFESFLIEEIGVDVRAKNNKGCTALRIAVSKGDEKCIDYLMKKDIDLEVENYLGQTCLHFAAERGDLEALQTWIEVGGDFNVVDKEGMTALHIAAESGHLQFVKKFLACAAEEAKNPYIGEGSVGSTLKEYGTVNRCDIKGRTALHLAAESGNVDLVKLLLENNADLTLTDLEGKNAIHFAFEHIGMLQFINEKNRNLVKQRTKDENTILHFLVLSSANREEWDEIAPWIIEQVDDTILNAKNAAGDTPLLLACQTGVWNVAELLLTRNVGINVADWCGKTALHYAAEKGNLKLVMLMHEKGADLTLTNDEGMNALHHATRHFEILLFIHEKNNDLLKQRLENGDTSLHVATGPLPSNSDAILWLVEQCENDLNETNSNGETPFLLACKRMKWNFAKILLDKNVDINVKDKNGRTALHYAVSLFRRDIIEDSYAYDLVQELCKRGADLALTDNDGKNAFHHAIENFNMALFIHELNGDLVKQLLNNGDTSLHLAIKLNKDNRNDKLIIWLVEQGVVDLNAKNASGETPLLLACERRWLKVAELLLTRNVEVNVSNRRGKTAMHYAAKNGNLSLVKLLHEKGADLTLSDNDGKNAFHHAITNYDMALFIHELNGDLVKQRLKNRDTSLHLAIKLYKRNKNDDVLNWLAEQDVIDLNVKNDLNETPLILACKKKLWPCTFFKILMSKNVDVNIRDVKGKSARDYIDDSCPTHLLRRFDELEEASPS
ncbi:putative ankyrin repeat protein RF_0381 [Cloeon dipterum]|uniref:putative ankyrin repeat protein RF_0381 n=1 Tax=Cloeon dipterum TaxID=197152 RepID=UPI00321F6A80